MMMQDYCDQIIKFQMDSKETPAQAGLQLWLLIEKVPEANWTEKILTGFVMSVLSHCDDKIRRELNSTVITDKQQLFRALRGFTLKRRNEDLAPTSEPESKRFRNFTIFQGNCHVCGRTGHRAYECHE